MAEKERITNPSMGSNELDEDTREEIHTGISSGTDTQLELTALGGKKKASKNKTNDDIQKEKNKEEFLRKNKV